MKKSTFIPRQVSEYDLRLLRIFKVVVECGGLSNAESVLNITRSTISVHLSNLENRVKFILAKRGRGGFALTEQGKSVYEATLNLFDSLDEFAYLVASLDEEVSGELVILCSDNVASSPQLKLAEVISRLNELAPKLQIAINNEITPEIENALLDSSAHIGIMPEFRNIAGLEYLPIFQESYFLCCGSRHPLFDVADSKIENETLHACMTVHPGVDVNMTGIEQLRQFNLTARAYQFDTRLPLVLSGNYLGFFPLSYAQLYLDQGLMRMIQPEQRIYNVDHVITTKHKQTRDIKVELFLQVLKEVGVHIEA